MTTKWNCEASHNRGLLVRLAAHCVVLNCTLDALPGLSVDRALQRRNRAHVTLPRLWHLMTTKELVAASQAFHPAPKRMRTIHSAQYGKLKCQ